MMVENELMKLDHPYLYRFVVILFPCLSLFAYMLYYMSLIFVCAFFIKKECSCDSFFFFLSLLLEYSRSKTIIMLIRHA
jgi:hypothetical protein